MAASFYAEDALDHIQHLPFTVSQIISPRKVNFMLLSGDRVYSVLDDTLYVYSMIDLIHPIATYPINNRVM
jgi:hypothetical protein